MNKTHVQNVMIKIGIPVDSKGFNYIEQAVYLLDKDEWKNSKWMALYETIGRNNGDIASRVERAIRHSLQCARSSKNVDDVEHYIGFERRGASASVKLLYLRLKQEEENGEN